MKEEKKKPDKQSRDISCTLSDRERRQQSRLIPQWEDTKRRKEQLLVVSNFFRVGHRYYLEDVQKQIYKHLPLGYERNGCFYFEHRRSDFYTFL